MINTKKQKGVLDKFEDILNVKYLECSQILGNDLDDEGGDDEDLIAIMKEVDLTHTSEVINKGNIVKMDQDRKSVGGALDITMKEVKGAEDEILLRLE